MCSSRAGKAGRSSRCSRSSRSDNYLQHTLTLTLTQLRYLGRRFLWHAPVSLMRLDKAPAVSWLISASV
jgi:hypothetical protein